MNKEKERSFAILHLMHPLTFGLNLQKVEQAVPASVKKLYWGIISSVHLFLNASTGYATVKLLELGMLVNYWMQDQTIFPPLKDSLAPSLHLQVMVQILKLCAPKIITKSVCICCVDIFSYTKESAIIYIYTHIQIVSYDRTNIRGLFFLIT